MMFSPSKYYRKRMEEHDAVFKQIAEHMINPKCYTKTKTNNTKTNTKTKKTNTKTNTNITNTNITNTNINITK